MSAIRINHISQADGRTLQIRWNDGTEQLFDVVELRRACPCASCVDEWTRQPRLKPENVPDTVRPVTIDSVGRYAMKIAFNDGHATGIYTYDALRSGKTRSASPVPGA